MNNSFTAVSACVISLALSDFAIAATPAQLAEAERLLSAKQPAEAYSLLKANHDAKTASAQEFFLLGVSAKVSGKLKASEAFLRKALKQAPEAGRIRLELAEVLYLRGNLNASRAELVTVRSSNPPEAVKANIDGFIAQVDAVKANPSKGPRKPAKSWSAYISTGFTSDSNVNAGPTDSEVFLFGLPFTLSPDGTKQRDEAIFARAGVSKRGSLSDTVGWQLRADLAKTNYFSTSSFDTTSISAGGGLRFKINDAVAQLNASYDVQRYNTQGNWFSQSLTLAPKLEYKVSPDLQFYLDTSISRKRYRSDNTRDLTSYTFNPSINYTKNANSNWAAGLQFGEDKSDVVTSSNSVRGLYVGYQHSFRELGLVAGLTASFKKTEYDGVEAAFLESRRDYSRTLSASVFYRVKQVPGLSVRGSMSFQDNNSTQDINTYDRTLINLQVTKGF